MSFHLYRALMAQIQSCFTVVGSPLPPNLAVAQGEHNLFSLLVSFSVSPKQHQMKSLAFVNTLLDYSRKHNQYAS